MANFVRRIGLGWFNPVLDTEGLCRGMFIVASWNSTEAA